MAPDDSLVRVADFRELGVSWLCRAVGPGRTPDAVLVTNHSMTLGVLQASPGEMAIPPTSPCSFDDMSWHPAATPLTPLAQPAYTWSESAGCSSPLEGSAAGWLFSSPSLESEELTPKRPFPPASRSLREPGPSRTG